MARDWKTYALSIQRALLFFIYSVTRDFISCKAYGNVVIQDDLSRFDSEAEKSEAWP
jgi:hypothetical protein